jgi:adiponectin receptor
MSLCHSQDNENVLGGYRREMSVAKAVRTILMWHNETLNIWSHLLACLCFAALLVALAFMQPGEKVAKW